VDFEFDQLLQLVVRWTHVVAGAYWLGTTAYFSWLDRTLARAEKHGGARLWMVHSGGFYVVEKRGPSKPEGHLHWFKWEALVTWISGVLLLVLVYHWSALLVFPDGPIGQVAARWVGLGTLAAGWIVYDLLWRSPLGRNEVAGATLSFALLAGASWGLCRVLSGRAAYIHVGALMGTIMMLNVWLRILPAQKRLVAAVNEGREPDLSLAQRAKQRSKHNTFLALPVILTMVSNHFPTVSYGHEWNWAILGAFVLVGWAARAWLNRE
jgi:uncharacterized membrane protein